MATILQNLNKLFVGLESHLATMLGSRLCFICESEIIPAPLSFKIENWPRQSKILCRKCLSQLEVENAEKLVTCKIGKLDCVSILPYDGIARDAVCALKYLGKRQLAEELALTLLPGLDLLSGDISTAKAKIIAVPLHRKKMKERGFNQSELIARHLAKFTGIKCDTRSLIRTRMTEPQYGLSKIKRANNVKEAFSASEKKLKGTTIILIDDVLTSGATALACGDALTNAGAERVLVLTVVRAILRKESQIDETGLNTSKSH